MKKILALFLSLALMIFSVSVAFAEDLSLNWENFNSIADNVFGEDAHFVNIPEVDAEIWVPDYLSPVTLTDSDRENNTIASFLSADETEMVFISYFSAVGLTLESYKQALEEKGLQADIGVINDIPVLHYYDPNSAALVVNYLTRDQYILQVLFFPFFDEVSSSVFTIMLSSIRPTQKDAEQMTSFSPVNPVSGLISK